MTNTMQSSWRPGCRKEIQQARAGLYQIIRRYMQGLGVLEVETPILNRSCNTDPQIEPLMTSVSRSPHHPSRPYYLHSSPELSMKRLLADGSGCIYQICKVFRDAEQGRQHQPEFTLLEWYRIGLDHHQLMGEINDLLRLLGLPEATKRTYADCFAEHVGVDPHHATDLALQQRCQREGFQCAKEARAVMLDFLFSQLVSRQLGLTAPLFIYDYPACQAALAQIRTEEVAVAERFELFVAGMELANGFHELTHAEQQLHRFENENSYRKQKGKDELPIDKAFIAALEHGLPDCAGVAFGLDRLLMILTQSQTIAEVLSVEISQ